MVAIDAMLSDGIIRGRDRVRPITELSALIRQFSKVYCVPAFVVTSIGLPFGNEFQFVTIVDVEHPIVQMRKEIIVNRINTFFMFCAA
jgi:hypothetical protein